MAEPEEDWNFLSNTKSIAEEEAEDVLDDEEGAE